VRKHTHMVNPLSVCTYLNFTQAYTAISTLIHVHPLQGQPPGTLIHVHPLQGQPPGTLIHAHPLQGQPPGTLIHVHPLQGQPPGTFIHAHPLQGQPLLSSRSICSCSKAVYKLVWHIPLPNVQWINTWWWAEELSETCRVSCQNKFVKLVHLVGFIIKKYGANWASIILKLSTPYILAVNHFFLFPLTAHNILNTYIYLSPCFKCSSYMYFQFNRSINSKWAICGLCHYCIHWPVLLTVVLRRRSQLHETFWVPGWKVRTHESSRFPDFTDQQHTVCSP
jgi:hypothetical protein